MAMYHRANLLCMKHAKRLKRLLAGGHPAISACFARGSLKWLLHCVLDVPDNDRLWHRHRRRSDGGVKRYELQQL